MAELAGNHISYDATPVDLDIAGVVVVDAELSNKEIEQFRITYSYTLLYEFDSSSTSGNPYKPASVSLCAYYRKKGIETLWTPIIQNGSSLFTISGEVHTTQYTVQESPRLPLGVYEVLIVRTSAPSISTNKADDIYLNSITALRFSLLRYNNTALLGVKIRATDQLYGAVPTITSLVQGTKIALPNLPINSITITNQAVISSQIATGATGAFNSTPGTTGTSCTYLIPDYTASWDGTLTYDYDTNGAVRGDRCTKYYSVNPVWCLYDLIMNDRYGLKEYYKISPDKLGLMKANFFIMGKYCDELISYVDALGNTQRRPRFMLNVVIDQTKNASEWIAAIASIMRANVFYAEGMFWIDIDRPKSISQLYNMASIKDFSQSSSSYKSTPNVFDVQWINPAKDYEIDMFRMESREFSQNPSQEERKKVLSLIGVTNFDQARSLGKYALLCGQVRNKSISFKTGTQGLRTMVGNVIGIQHDVPRWGWGGKVVKVEGAVVTVHPRIDYNTSFGSLKMSLSNSTGVPVWCNIATPATSGEYSTVTVTSGYTDENGQAVSFTPQVGSSFVVHPTTGGVAPFLVTGINRSAEEYVEIHAVNYDESIYAACDDNSDLGIGNSINYSVIATPTRDSVTNVSSRVSAYLDSSGAWKKQVNIQFTPPLSSFWRGAEMHYTISGYENYVKATSVSGNSFTVTDLLPETSYTFVITSVYAVGKQSIRDALNDTSKVPFIQVATGICPIAPTAFDSTIVSVRNLQLLDAVSTSYFVGSDASFSWEPPESLEVTAARSRIAAAGQAALPADLILVAAASASLAWLRDYKVEILKNEELRREAYTTEPRYVYTHEFNHADGITRDFTIRVTAISTTGVTYVPSELTVHNAAPAILS